MSKDVKPHSPIAIRFQHDLKINGKGEPTQQSYVRMLRKFSEFLGRDSDSASEGLRVADCLDAVPLLGPDGPTRSHAGGLGHRTPSTISAHEPRQGRQGCMMQVGHGDWNDCRSCRAYRHSCAEGGATPVGETHRQKILSVPPALKSRLRSNQERDKRGRQDSKQSRWPTSKRTFSPIACLPLGFLNRDLDVG
jgi:hypothetical protein